MRNWLRFMVLAGVCWGAVPCRADPQSLATTADLTGTIRDERGGAVGMAKVTAINIATNLPREVTPGTDGRFEILGLPPGSYRVTINAAGFGPYDREVTLTLGSVVDLQAQLTLAKVQQNVTVATDTPFVDARRTVISSVVSSHQIENLPTNGRDYLAFSLTTAGVVTDRTPAQGSSATSGLAFDGQRARANNIQVDGFNNNDDSVGGVRAGFSQEAVREFQVLNNSFSAEFGKASGGVVNIVTKSGGNRRSTEAFYLFRDESLNARDHFEKFDPAGQRITRDKAPYGQHQFGASTSGPIRRDRTFYFAAYEQLDIDASNFVTIDDQTPVVVFGQPVGTPADVLRRAGFPVETGNVPYSIKTRQVFGRIDHQVRPGQQLDVRINWATVLNENSEPWGGLVARSRGGALDSDDVMAAASHTWFLSPTMIHEVRGQAAYHDQNVRALDPSCIGPCDTETEGGPTLEVTGVASVGRQRFTPQARETMVVQATDTFTMQLQQQLLKVGVDYNYANNMSGSLPLHFGGRYIFQALPAIPGVLPAPISAIQAVALGLPAAYVQGYGSSASRYTVHDFSAFAQDDWTLTKDLTVKLGLRYQTQLWPSTTYTAPGVGPFTIPVRHTFAPRLGAAWNPGGSRTLSIHGSYGLFYDNQLTALPGVADIVDGTSTGVRTLVTQLPNTLALAAWNAPGHRFPEPSTPFPSLIITVDPSLKTPYAHHASAGFRKDLAHSLTLGADLIYVRGFDDVGSLDYNPLVPALGPGRRPDDLVVNGAAVPGSSASVLQYTTFAETWYRGLTVSLTRTVGRYQVQGSYTISKAEDTASDYLNAFIPQDTGVGRDPANPRGLPIGFDPLLEKGPSLQDQRHRFVAAGIWMLPWDVQLSSIITIGSGRPYNILAGTDLNGDGNGGSFPPDRARLDPTTSVMRNSGTMPSTATVDIRVSRRFPLGGHASCEAIGEVFNLFNRTNYTEINNIFGTGFYPANPLPTYGHFEKAGPPLQAQLGLRVRF